VTYCLKLPNQWHIHSVFHASLLAPYLETKTHSSNFPQPSPDSIEGEEQYEVEAIAAHRKRGRGYQYLMKWSGYPSNKNTWQSSKDLKEVQEILSSYNLMHHL
jgi:hypothetical protein